MTRRGRPLKACGMCGGPRTESLRARLGRIYILVCARCKEKQKAKGNLGNIPVGLRSHSEHILELFVRKQPA